ncbi:MAG: SufD family Fe-S cluster assembly protein, partial [Rhodobacter sp.]
MPVPQAKLDALAVRIAGLDFARGGWLGAARAEALARLGAMGLPTKRDEYWRYTDPADLTAPQAPRAATFAAEDEPPVFDGIDRLRIVFVDGVFDPALSDDLTLAGVEIELLSKAGQTDIHWAREVYGLLEARGQTPVQRPLAALNTAFATEGILIRATGGAAKPVSLIYLHKSETSDVILHHCIRIESGAGLTVLENGPAAARFTKVMEVDVAPGGRFHHVRAQGRDHERRAATHVFARLGAESLFKSFTLTANGVLTRNEVVIELLGDDGIAHIAGAAVGDGAFHHDDTVFITHAGLRCESR